VAAIWRYLHGLDAEMSRQGYCIVRYADDFVILCATEAEAQAALPQVQAWTAAQGLTLHPDKTHLGDCRQVGRGFDFLGYRFEGGWRQVHQKSFRAIRGAIRAKRVQPAARARYAASGWLKSGSLAADPG